MLRLQGENELAHNNNTSDCRGIIENLRHCSRRCGMCFIQVEPNPKVQCNLFDWKQGTTSSFSPHVDLVLPMRFAMGHEVLSFFAPPSPYEYRFHPAKVSLDFRCVSVSEQPSYIDSQRGHSPWVEVPYPMYVAQPKNLARTCSYRTHHWNAVPRLRWRQAQLWNWVDHMLV